MKVFMVVVLCGIVSLCCAEPPRFRSSRLRSGVLSRQELAPSAAPAPAPYPPSGWKPEGETLELPTEQTEAPAGEYGPPATEYGPPANEYGPPATEYGPPEGREAEEPVPETVIPLNGRLRSSYLLLVDPATLQRAQIVSRRAPAKLRRLRL